MKKHAEAKKLLGLALETSNASGYVRLRAMALGESAVLAFRQDDVARAKKHAIESNEIARQLGFDALCFRNTWYLRQLAEQAGDTGLVASYTQTLRVYLSKAPGHMPEAEAFRALEASSEKGGAK